MAQGVSAHFCQLWDWGGRGVFHSDSLSFLQLLAVASWGSGLILLEGSLHTATNSFVTRVRWEGPSRAATAITIKTYPFNYH